MIAEHEIYFKNFIDHVSDARIEHLDFFDLDARLLMTGNILLSEATNLSFPLLGCKM